MTRPDPTPPADHVEERVAAARAAGRAARRALTDPARTAAEAAIATHLLALDELAGRGHVALTRSTDGEVDLTGVAAPLRDRGWTVYLPVPGPGRSMAFRPWHAGDVLVPGRFGIDEPPADGRRDLDAGGMDVVVVPCTAVDRRGARLGFGAGYYDRALGGARSGDGRARPLRVGVAFEVQVLADLPERPWDVHMDVVVTEAGAVRTGDGR